MKNWKGHCKGTWLFCGFVEKTKRFLKKRDSAGELNVVQNFSRLEKWVDKIFFGK